MNGPLKRPARHVAGYATPSAGPTQHNHQVVFGRRVENCQRCAELQAGAPPRPGWSDFKRRQEEVERYAAAEHFAAGGPHALGKCGPVCTFGDW